MPIDFRKFRREIERQGYFLQCTSKGHYWVVTPDGGKLVVFAVSHGARGRAFEVLDSYVRIVRRTIQNHKQATDEDFEENRE